VGFLDFRSGNLCYSRCS